MNEQILQLLQTHVQNAQNILLLSHEKSTADSIGSVLSLALGLQTLGKKITVALPEEVTVEHSSFVGVNKIVREIGKKNFVISLDYIEGSIEKVSYNIEGNKFNLVIEPRDGYTDFSEDKVHYTHAGALYDLVFVVDTIHLGGLKHLYDQNKELFTDCPLINIDHHPNNTQFGTVNIVDSRASSSAEIVFTLLQGLDVQINHDIAMNILNALYSATQNFTSKTMSAKAFEIAAQTMTLGAQRFTVPVALHEDIDMPAPERVEAVPFEEAVVSPDVHADEDASQAPQIAPSDWLKPKIFKSSQLS